MKSMTGYGCGSAEHEGVRVVVEIRTLNHRHLDVRVSGPAGCMAAAAAVERAVRERILRGRVDVVLTVEGEALDRERFASVAAAYRSLERIRADLGVDEPIDLGAVFAAVAVSSPGARGGTSCGRAVEAATQVALGQVEEMRATEGAMLRARLREDAEALGRLVGELRVVARTLREALPERLRGRMELLAEAAGLRPLDQDRLRQELAMLLDRSDVTEEVDRLVCHVDHLRTTLDADRPAGRRGDFLVQEILRESSTLAAKAQDAAASRLASELRAGAEQLREQLQNVE